MPSFDRAFGQTAFLETAGMDLDHLLDCVVKGFSLQLLAGQPFLEGSGGDVLDLVFLGHRQPGVEHVDHGILVLRVERVGPTDHHDEVDVELEGAKPFEHVLQILGVGSREQGDLHVVEFDREVRQSRRMPDTTLRSPERVRGSLPASSGARVPTNMR